MLKFQPLMTLFMVIMFFTAILPASAQEADLAAVKSFALENSEAVQMATAAYLEAVEQYAAIIADMDADYEAAWEAHGEELAALLAEAKDQWLLASTHYELEEGIVAGVPSLAYFDVLLDAGPSAAEAPDEALEWQLELPDGQVLESPGNYFHSLTEPTLWGTNPDYVGLAVDLDGNGEIEPGEILPEVNMFLGVAQGFAAASEELVTAITEWEPTLEDAFTAMVIMVPTMSEYFEQWKESAFINETSESDSFIAVSRLFDINGILTGLDLTYDQVRVLVAAENTELDTQIDTGFESLLGYVGDLYAQEQDGTIFTAEEADLFGTQAQQQAETLAALIAQSAEELDLTLELE